MSLYKLLRGVVFRIRISLFICLLDLTRNILISSPRLKTSTQFPKSLVQANRFSSRTAVTALVTTNVFGRWTADLKARGDFFLVPAAVLPLELCDSLL